MLAEIRHVTKRITTGGVLVRRPHEVDAEGAASADRKDVMLINPHHIVTVQGTAAETKINLADGSALFCKMSPREVNESILTAELRPQRH